MPAKANNLIGLVFGRLTIISRNGSKRYKTKTTPLWLCKCSCGNSCERTSQGLNRKVRPVKSCGCLTIEHTKKANTIHGMKGSTEYTSWTHMKDRCLNPKSKDYNRYGGRGINVCDRWLDFNNFFDDMGVKPSLANSIERINNNKGYSPKNCKWATPKDQANNRRSSRLIKYNGKIKTLSQWADSFNLPRNLISKRLLRGWSVEKTFRTPIMNCFNRY